MLSIKERQEYLKYLGLYKGKIDGIEGKQTKTAIKNLQAKYFTRKSDIDGLYGKNTDILLVNAYRVKKYTKNFDLTNQSYIITRLNNGYTFIILNSKVLSSIKWCNTIHSGKLKFF